MSGWRVLISHSEVPQKAIDLLNRKYELIICPELPNPTKDQILNRVSGVNGLYWVPPGLPRIDKELLDKAGPNLKVIATVSAGYNHIDVAEVKRRGIKLANTPNVLNASVAETAIGLLLACAHRMPEGRQLMLENKWKKGGMIWLLGQDLQQSTVGIVGFGGIGQAIAKRIKPFDVSRILYCGHKPKPEAAELGAEFVPFNTLLQESDWIFISCPLNDKTRHMFSKNAFTKMKTNSILINISRGEVVDQDALIEALETEQIWGAGLDVMYPEPLPPDHKLLTLKNCVVIPHLGSATVRTRTDMAMLAAQNIIAGLEGTPLPTPVV